MGKSIRSKIKKRLRTVKRQRADAMIYTPQTQEHHDSLQRLIEGRSVSLAKPKNAFKYPDEKGACFPQHTIMKPIDYRAENLPMAGFVFRGNRRKYSKEEQEQLNNIIKHQHPKMEVLAGGGAVLASTGQRISKAEADLLATAAERPEDAAIAMAGPANSSSAVAAAVAQNEAAAASAPASAVKAGDVDMDEEPENQADTSRRPVFKDDRRAKRAAEHRPRSNAVKKKGKAKAQVEITEAPKSKGKATQPAAAAAAAPSSAAAALAPAPAPAAPPAAAAAPTPTPAAPVVPAPAEQAPEDAEVSKKKPMRRRKKKASMTD